MLCKSADHVRADDADGESCRCHVYIEITSATLVSHVSLYTARSALQARRQPNSLQCWTTITLAKQASVQNQAPRQARLPAKPRHQPGLPSRSSSRTGSAPLQPAELHCSHQHYGGGVRRSSCHHADLRTVSGDALRSACTGAAGRQPWRSGAASGSPVPSPASAPASQLRECSSPRAGTDAELIGALATVIQVLLLCRLAPCHILPSFPMGLSISDGHEWEIVAVFVTVTAFLLQCWSSCTGPVIELQRRSCLCPAG